MRGTRDGRLLRGCCGRPGLFRQLVVAYDLRRDHGERYRHPAVRLSHLDGRNHRTLASYGAGCRRDRPRQQEEKVRSPRRGPSAAAAWSVRRVAARCGGLAAGLAAAAGLEAATCSLWRPWCLSWGATKDEAAGVLPGDELLPEPDIVTTRAVWVDASPAAIWPWLVQIGPGRAGAYTYDWLENLFGLGMHSADQIL